MIRIKLITTVVLTIVLLTLLLYTVSTTVLLKSYEVIEQSLMHENTVRVSGAIRNYSTALNIKLRDWAQWDDTYAFINDQNETYQESNLANTTLANLEINFMLFLNADGGVVFAKLIDLDESEIELPTDALVSTLTRNAGIAEALTSLSGVSELVQYDEKILLIEGLPILPTDGSGPARGMMFFGRFLDPSLIESLTELTQLPIELFNTTVSTPPTDVEQATEVLNTGDEYYVATLDKDTIAGYFILRTSAGVPVSTVRTTTSREVYAQGVRTMSLFIPIAGLSIFLFGFFVLVLFELFLLKRFARLSKEVAGIAVDKLTGAHVFEGKQDEVGALATKINHLLTQLSLAQHKEEEAHESLKKSLAQTEQMNKLMVDRELKMIELKKELARHTTQNGDLNTSGEEVHTESEAGDS